MLTNQGITTLGDLDRKSLDNFRKIRQVGNVSLAELSELAADAERGRFCGPKRITPVAFTGFLDLVHAGIECLPERRRKILLMTFGANGAPTSQAMIGRKFKLTRERSRQLVNQAVREIRLRAGVPLLTQLKFWASETRKQVRPLTPELFEYLADAPLKYRVEFYLRLFAAMVPELVVWPDGQRSASKPGRREQLLIQALWSMMKLESDKRRPGAPEPALSLKAAYKRLVAEEEFSGRLGPRLTVEEFLHSLERTDLLVVTAVHDDRCGPCRFTLARTSARLTVPEILKRLLDASDRPLTVGEIKRSAKASPDLSALKLSKLSYNYLRPSAGFFLLGPKRYGTARHLKLSERETRQIVREFYKLLRQTRRPTSISEVFSKNLFAWTSCANPYEVAHHLRQDVRFTDMGRLMFGLVEWRLAKRPKLAQIAAELLAHHGRPLHISELYHLTQQRRSVSRHGYKSLLDNCATLEPLGCGYYGAAGSRDSSLASLVKCRTLIERALRYLAAPIRFGDLCSRLMIGPSSQHAKLLWAKLKEAPDVLPNFALSKPDPNAVINAKC